MQCQHDTGNKLMAGYRSRGPVRRHVQATPRRQPTVLRLVVGAFVEVEGLHVHEHRLLHRPRLGAALGDVVRVRGAGGGRLLAPLQSCLRLTASRCRARRVIIRLTPLLELLQLGIERPPALRAIKGRRPRHERGLARKKAEPRLKWLIRKPIKRSDGMPCKGLHPCSMCSVVCAACRRGEGGGLG